MGYFRAKTLKIHVHELVFAINAINAQNESKNHTKIQDSFIHDNKLSE